jgi:hypothetical protein
VIFVHKVPLERTLQSYQSLAFSDEETLTNVAFFKLFGLFQFKIHWIFNKMSIVDNKHIFKGEEEYFLFDFFVKQN